MTPDGRPVACPQCKSRQWRTPREGVAELRAEVAALTEALRVAGEELAAETARANDWETKYTLLNEVRNLLNEELFALKGIAPQEMVDVTTLADKQRVVMRKFKPETQEAMGIAPAPLTPKDAAIAVLIEQGIPQSIIDDAALHIEMEYADKHPPGAVIPWETALPERVTTVMSKGAR